MPVGSNNEFVYFPEAWENLDGDYRTFEGEKLPGSGFWEKGDMIVPDEKTGKWKKYTTAYGTGSPWYVDDDVADDAETITVHEQPFIKITPPKYRPRAVIGSIMTANDLIGDWASSTNFQRYSTESTRGRATLSSDFLVTPGTKGNIYFNIQTREKFVPIGQPGPSGYTSRGQATALNVAESEGDMVEYFLAVTSVSATKPSLFEADGTVRLQNDLMTAEVSGSFYTAIPISGASNEYEEYKFDNEKLYRHPRLSVTNGTRLEDVPHTHLFENDSQFLASPVLIFKSRKEGLVAGISHVMIGLDDATSGSPVYDDYTLTIPSLSYFSASPNTVTRDYLKTLLIGCYVPDDAIASEYNPDQEIKSIVWDMGHRGIPIPCTNEPPDAEEDLSKHQFNFYTGEVTKIVTAPNAYRGIDVTTTMTTTEVSGALVRDKGMVFLNILPYTGSSADYTNPYSGGTNNYYTQLRNGSCRGMGYLFAGNNDFGVTGVNSATVGTRHGSTAFHGVVIGRQGMSDGGQWSNDTNWWHQYYLTGDRLLPDLHKDSFVGPRDYNGSPISIKWTGTVKDGWEPFYDDHGDIFDHFPMATDIWKKFNPAQPLPFDVRKIKTRLANPPLETPKPDDELTFESDLILHSRDENDEEPVITKNSGAAFTMTRVESANSSYVYGVMDNWASYDTSTSRIGTLDFRGPFAWARGLFWLEQPKEGGAEGEVTKHYIVENNIVSDYPIYRFTTAYSNEIAFDGIGSRTQRNWNYGFSSLPGSKVMGVEAYGGKIHYKIDLMIEVVDWSVGNYAISTPQATEAWMPAGYVPSVVWTYEGEIS